MTNTSVNMQMGKSSASAYTIMQVFRLASAVSGTKTSRKVMELIAL